MKITTVLLLIVLFGTGQAFADSLPTDPDAQVIYQLKKAGSDLSKKHPIEFFIYFKSSSTAKSAASELQEIGYKTTVEQSASSDEWLLLAKMKMYPSLAELQKIRKRLDDLGDYDGWGTPIVK